MDEKKTEGRTAYIEKNMPEGLLKKFGLGLSRLVDKTGYTQEKEYKGKSMEELEKKPGAEPVKKAKGGAIKSASARADGCAQRGKTRGRMV